MGNQSNAKIAIITGASRGLGLALSASILKLGYTVYGISRTQSRWKTARSRVHHSERFFLNQLDVRSEKEIYNYAKRIYRKHRQIDLLVNNAGYASKPRLTHLENLRTFRSNIESNLSSVFIMCKYFIPMMQKKSGSLIVNISSMAGTRAVPKMAAYSASKFGVIAISQAIAKEHPDQKPKCITVCPGGINTMMRTNVFGAQDAARQQSADFVANVIADVIQEKIFVESGGDIMIRHGEVTGIHPCPSA